MIHTDFKTCKLNNREKLLGTVWLVFESLFFSTLLQVGNALLPAPLPQTVVNFVFFLTNFAVVVFLLRRYLLEQLRLLPDLIERVLYISALGYLVYRLAHILTVLVLLALDPDFASINDQAISQLVAEDYILMFVGTVILAPVAEECLFRGLVFRGIYDRSPVLAWILSVSLFAAIHIIGYLGAYPLPTLLLCFVQYIPAGICLAAAYRLSGSIICPILIHVAVNFVGMTALGNS